jgi:uncharacterized protein
LVSSEPTKPAKEPQALLLILGGLVVLSTAALAGRTIWEETTLTIEHGPQALGFSLAHGNGALLLLAPPLLALWIAIALAILATSLWRKKRLSRWFSSTLASAVVVMAILAIPPEFFQWLFIASFAKSSHAADLMFDAAGDGNVRTVRAYLAHGIPLEATNYEGSTSAYVAAAGGSVPMLKFLASQGANLNATNSYGDSPLDAAINMHHVSAASFLKAHGAIDIRGTDEQRNAARDAIVRKEIEREQQLR